MSDPSPAPAAPNRFGVDLTPFPPSERPALLRALSRRLQLKQRARSTRGLSRFDQQELNGLEKELRDAGFTHLPGGA